MLNVEIQVGSKLVQLRTDLEREHLREPTNSMIAYTLGNLYADSAPEKTLEYATLGLKHDFDPLRAGRVKTWITELTSAIEASKRP